MTIEKGEASKVSVVIPTYERPEFLKGAIETSLKQTYGNLEVIVVDDGSEEPYAEDVVSNFSKTVKCVRHEHNKGLSAARNTGIRESTGEFVAFLDDDDRWHKSKLSHQYQSMKESPSVGLSTCLVAAISPENDILHCETQIPDGDCSINILTGNKIGTPSRVLVRKECIKDVGLFDESLPTKQDWDFYIRICQDWQVVGIKDYLCFRTVHKSMSSSPTASARDNRTILAKHEELIRSHGQWKQAKAEVNERVGRAYLHSAQMGNAREELWESVKLAPTTRRIGMLFLSLTNHRMVDFVVPLKRKLSSWTNCCTEISMTAEAVPGLNS